MLWHNLCVCPAEGKVLVLEPLAEVPRGKLKFIFPNPLCKSACLPGSSPLPLPVLFCCCFSGSRAPPPASILKMSKVTPSVSCPIHTGCSAISYLMICEIFCDIPCGLRLKVPCKCPTLAVMVIHSKSLLLFLMHFSFI